MFPDAENMESGLARNGVEGGVKELWSERKSQKNFLFVSVELVTLGLLGTKLGFGLSIRSGGPGV